MKRFIFSLAAVLATTISFAQDVIVKKDGSLIQAKITKIASHEVEYKKWSYLEGPSYTIPTVDILAINYQNGDKETFEGITSTSQTASTTITPSVTKYAPAPENEDSLRVINNAFIEFADKKLAEKKKKKEAKHYIVQYGITENSVIESDELSIRCELGISLKHMKNDYYFKSIQNVISQSINGKMKNKMVNGHKSTIGNGSGKPVVRITLENKSDETLFIDLANTFLSVKKKATPYYIPSATTTSTTSTTGGAFNLGGITNALGIGGAVGALANVTTVGGSQGKTTSNVVYSQRVHSIPPHSTIVLPDMCLIDEKFFYECPSPVTGDTGIVLGTNQQLKVGEKLEYNETNTPYQFSFFTTVSHTEDFTISKTAEATMYCKSIVGSVRVKGLGKGYVNLDVTNYSENGLYNFGRKRF